MRIDYPALVRFIECSDDRSQEKNSVFVEQRQGQRLGVVSVAPAIDVEAAGLLTTLNEQFDRVAMHAVRTELLRRQVEGVGLPLRLIKSIILH